MGRLPAGFFVKLIPFLILSLPSLGMANGMPDGPESTESTYKSAYTVKKGDTLWDISSGKLKDPFLWKKIWEVNPQIKNPHLIFPGHTINIPDTKTGPAEEMAEQSGEASKMAPGDFKETGRIIIPTKVEPKNIPIQKKKYLVSKEILLRSGFISGGINSKGKISSSPSGKELIGVNDYVYVDTDQPATKKSKFYIITKPTEVIHPVTHNSAGHLYRINGILEITGEENGNQKALITESYEETTTGDLLSAFTPVEQPIAPDKERRPGIKGAVIKLWNNQELASTNDILYLDKGTNDGILVGDLFNIITNRKPHTHVGEIQVISAKEKTSVAIIRTATAEIQAGDVFKN